MSIDQINLYIPENPNIFNIFDHKEYLSFENSDINCIDTTIIKKTQISDNKYIPGIFYTNEGYRGGYILSQKGKNYEVLFIRDEFGATICEVKFISITAHVFPKRKNQKELWIYTNPDIKAEGYIKVGESIDIGLGIGSGVNSTLGGIRTKYPIYNPLTFHNLHHRNTLIYASSFILQIIDEYLHNQTLSDEILNRANWLVNVVLIIDGHDTIPKDVFLEALTNFCLDYIILSPGTFIRQPINYIFDILRIDGVYHQKDLSVSYIPTDFDGVFYS